MSKYFIIILLPIIIFTFMVGWCSLCLLDYKKKMEGEKENAENTEQEN